MLPKTLYYKKPAKLIRIVFYYIENAVSYIIGFAMTDYVLSDFPPLAAGLETNTALRKVVSASRCLAELKGATATISNEIVLTGLLTLQEAKDSSAVEGVVATFDELYKAALALRGGIVPAASEVHDYADALRQGFQLVRKNGSICLDDILLLQRIVKKDNVGLRKRPGTVIKNVRTSEVIYTPPQDAREVERLMNELVDYINTDTSEDIDPLVKMALIHHRFESIHPFYDGNGRIGRILNVLYLASKGLLDLPVLYLSRYIIQNRREYYRQLQAVRTSEAWEPWLLYMLNAVEQTSRHAIALIGKIEALMQEYKHRIRKELPKIYSQGLLNHLFKHVYTKRGFAGDDLGVTYITATKYLNQLVEKGVLEEAKIGRSNYYINRPLFGLFSTND